MSDQVKKYFCPRLLDYVIIVGPRDRGARNSGSCGVSGSFRPDSAQDNLNNQHDYDSRVPHLLRRFPPEDHKDSSLPPDVVIFCQPEGCTHLKSNLNGYNNPSEASSSFVFLLTEKDTSRIRYGVCLNFYRPLQRCKPSSRLWHQNQRSRSRTITTKNQFKLKENYLLNEILSVAPAMGGDTVDVQQIANNKLENQADRSISGESGLRASSALSSCCELNNGSDLGDSFNRLQRNQSCFQKFSEPIADCSRGRNEIAASCGGRRKLGGHERASSNKVTYALTSICIISHHPFFSTFRETLYVMKKFIQACDERHLNASYAHQQVSPFDWLHCDCLVENLSQLPATRQHQQQQQQRQQPHRQNLVRNHHFTCAFSTPIWSLLTRPNFPEHLVPQSMLADLIEIESWTLRLLSVPAPVPGRTKIELDIMPSSLKAPLLFALPDHTRLSLVDFPLHLPLELLGVKSCLQVLTCILLEHKLAIQSKDYNALSMSIMALVAMIYPLEYMFPVIPLLPSYMSSAEQLLLAPTPFIIGLPSSFFKYRPNFVLPNDVWLVDLDSNCVKKPANAEDLPPLPEREGNLLMINLQQILDCMSMSACDASSELTGDEKGTEHGFEVRQSLPASPRKGMTGHSQSSRRDSIKTAGHYLQMAANRLTTGLSNQTAANFNNAPPSGVENNGNRRWSASKRCDGSGMIEFNPRALLARNRTSGGTVDLDAADVAVRVSMVNFFNSHEVLANFIEHTRTIRLYPRPVVSFQKSSFLQSRRTTGCGSVAIRTNSITDTNRHFNHQRKPAVSQFLWRLVDTQAVEYLAEWMLFPENVAFQRIQTGIFDPADIGDKYKWYQNSGLELLRYQVTDSENEEFYEEIANLIRNPSFCLNQNDRFAHYFEGILDVVTEHDRLKQQQNRQHQLDVESNIESHSPRITSTSIEMDLPSDFSSPFTPSWSTCSPSRLADANLMARCKIMSLDEVLHQRREVSSVSSSSSDDDDDEQILQGSSSCSDDSSSNEAVWSHAVGGEPTKRSQLPGSIPVYYQHAVTRLPPLRCNIRKCFKPCNKLICSLSEARRWKLDSSSDASANRLALDGCGASERKTSYDSSATEDYEDSLKNVPLDSSSCDESRTEEFNFECFNALPASMGSSLLDAAGATSASMSPDVETLSVADCAVSRPTESIDSDTIVAVPEVSVSLDERLQPTKNSEIMHEIDANNNYEASPISLEDGRPQADSVSSIPSLERMSLSRGVVRLVDRCSSSLCESSSSDVGGQQTAVQMGASRLIDKFKSEASSAMREALDAGKAALRTSSLSIPTAADGGRQQLILGIRRSFGTEQRESTRIPANEDPASSRSSIALRSKSQHQRRSPLLANYGPSIRRALRSPLPLLSQRRSLNGRFNFESHDWFPSEDRRALEGISRTRECSPRSLADSSHPMTHALFKSGESEMKSDGDSDISIHSMMNGDYETQLADDTIVALNPQLFRPDSRPKTRIAINLTTKSTGVDIDCMKSRPALPRLRLVNVRSSKAFSKTIDDYQTRTNQTRTNCSHPSMILPPYSTVPADQRLIQQSHLIRHSSGSLSSGAKGSDPCLWSARRTRFQSRLQQTSPFRSQQSDSENRQFLKELSAQVLKGEGVGWLKLNRLRSLMEDESYRDLILTQLNQNCRLKLKPEDRLELVPVSRATWQGMLKVCSCIVGGLEQSYQNNKWAGMASAFHLLELAHTHYWERSGANSDCSPASASSLWRHGGSRGGTVEEVALEPGASKLNGSHLFGSDAIGDSSEQGRRISDFDLVRYDEERSGATDDLQHRKSPSSFVFGERQRADLLLALDNQRVNSPIGTHWTSFSERLTSDGSSLSSLTNGAGSASGDSSANCEQSATATMTSRVFLYEGLVRKEHRSALWDQLQFWEEAFLDVVSHERCLIGLDQGSDEMLERYKMLQEIDKKRLEHEEDRLLSTILSNMVSHMLMLQVDNQMIKQKVRRLLGKCHIGLVNSAELNRLLEKIDSLKGNAIELRPMASRQKRSQTFALHRGTDPTGEIVFMEVNNEGLVVRGLDGQVAERWWYERLINMTYSPRNKMVCFWRKSAGRTVLDKFHTRKCRELYTSIKESMQNAANSRGSARVCSELGGEFPILDVRSGEGGILQVCMDGVGLMFATNKYFIRLENIRKCFTQEGSTFVLEEYNPKTRQLVQNNFKSQMADQICYAVLCVFSYVAAGQDDDHSSAFRSTASTTNTKATDVD